MQEGSNNTTTQPHKKETQTNYAEHTEVNYRRPVLYFNLTALLLNCILAVQSYLLS